MKINLTEDDIKEAIEFWLKHRLLVENVEILSWSNDVGCSYSVETDPARFLHKED